MSWKFRPLELVEQDNNRNSGPLWVKSRHCGISNQCPLYPQKRTSELGLR